jgi:hypothetical protein
MEEDAGEGACPRPAVTYVLAWDVGTRNLSYCLAAGRTPVAGGAAAGEPSWRTCSILRWGLIDLLDDAPDTNASKAVVTDLTVRAVARIEPFLDEVIAATGGARVHVVIEEQPTAFGPAAKFNPTGSVKNKIVANVIYLLAHLRSLRGEPLVPSMQAAQRKSAAVRKALAELCPGDANQTSGGAAAAAGAASTVGAPAPTEGGDAAAKAAKAKSNKAHTSNKKSAEAACAAVLAARPSLAVFRAEHLSTKKVDDRADSFFHATAFLDSMRPAPAAKGAAKRKRATGAGDVAPAAKRSKA